MPAIRRQLYDFHAQLRGQLLLALHDETVTRIDPVTIGRAQADGRGVNLLVDTQHGIGLVEDLQGFAGAAGEAAVDDDADFLALVQVDPAPCGKAVGDVVQTVFERRVIGQPRAVQITFRPRPILRTARPLRSSNTCLPDATQNCRSSRSRTSASTPEPDGVVSFNCG